MPKNDAEIIEYLKREFDYDHSTGLLRRKNTARKPYPWRKIGAGGRYLGHTTKLGTVYLHRAVWAWHHGYFPPTIDHKDRDTGNNRIENLRACTLGQNQHNSKRKSNNRSGAKGVAFCKGYRKPWRARLTVDKQIILLGYFGTVAEAAAAYAAGVEKYAPVFGRPDASPEINKKD